LAVIETGNFLNVSKENVEENEIDNLFNQRGEEPDKEVYAK
jgi:hypothetical protein